MPQKQLPCSYLCTCPGAPRRRWRAPSPCSWPAAGCASPPGGSGTAASPPAHHRRLRGNRARQAAPKTPQPPRRATNTPMVTPSQHRMFPVKTCFLGTCLPVVCILQDFETVNRTFFLMARKKLRSTLNPWVHLSLQRLKSRVTTWEAEQKEQGGFREEEGRVKMTKIRLQSSSAEISG